MNAGGEACAACSTIHTVRLPIGPSWAVARLDVGGGGDDPKDTLTPRLEGFLAWICLSAAAGAGLVAAMLA
jgi:hypothetical protein